MTHGLDVIAKYYLKCLSAIAKKGPRSKPPSLAEIETASDAAFNPSTFGEPLDAVFRLQERTYPTQRVPIVFPFLADGVLALGGTKSKGISRVPGLMRLLHSRCGWTAGHIRWKGSTTCTCLHHCSNVQALAARARRPVGAVGDIQRL
ncbi:hypothetical protein EDB87DRAFT_302411 [Lactarius vividus]|nr:hypothetical protein EDB87DRAFT_302411 [Lactarius vividus]